MSEKIEVCKVSELEEGVIKGVLVKDREIIVVRINGEYYAAAGRCPHMKGNLSAAALNGTVITCPRHGSRFDLKDGSVVRWVVLSGIVLKAAEVIHVAKHLKIYRVEIDGDKVLVEV